MYEFDFVINGEALIVKSNLPKAKFERQWEMLNKQGVHTIEDINNYVNKYNMDLNNLFNKRFTEEEITSMREEYIRTHKDEVEELMASRRSLKGKGVI